MKNTSKKYKLPFHKTLFYSISSLFVIFALAILLFQYNLEKNTRKEILSNILQDYNKLIHREMEVEPIVESRWDRIINSITDKDLRVTIISARDGHVITDSHHDDSLPLESHLSRPEIKEALRTGEGSALRHSYTLNQDYFYSAKLFNDSVIIRSSLPFESPVVSMLNVDNQFIFFLTATSIIAILLLFYFSNRLGRSISVLQDFSYRAERDMPIDTSIHVPGNDIGEITQNIIRIYKNLRLTKNQLSIEKEKLIKHLQFAKQGLAVFSDKKELILANNLFIQYIQLIADDAILRVDDIFAIPEFSEIKDFIDHNLFKDHNRDEFRTDSLIVNKSSKTFQIECIIFQDNTFEIAITNITHQEEESRLKKQLTQNIAHELKTPVSSIQGYLETILNNPQVDKEKIDTFLQRCYAQTIRLTGLLRDISLLNRIDESQSLFEVEQINLSLLIHEVVSSSSTALENKKMKAALSFSDDIVIHGNYSLLYSIFQNLVDNAIAYAGENTTIAIHCNLQDNDYYYFSFSDNGTGISDEHLNRIFDRFYRVDKGRSRKIGGTGLGLAIVKNAIIFHKGEILAKKRQGGGVEFIFTLKKL